MKVVMRTASVLVLILSFSFGASAKEYLVGFKGDAFKKAQTSRNFMNLSSVSEVKVFKNLEMMIVDVQSKKDLFALHANGDIEFVESVQNFKAPQKIYSRPGTLYSHNKRLVDYPWGILEVDAPAAWPHSKSGADVKVLVLDTGIDKEHPNIASRFVEGRNLINPQGSPSHPYPYFDDQGHGTHVSGTILADGFGAGVVGVAPQASLYAGKVCGGSGCPGGAIIAGVEWAIEAKMHVVNMSLGGAFGSAAGAAVYKRAEEADVVIIAASGNDGRNSIGYPAKYEHVLSVGAIDEDLNVASFSNWDADLDVVAPGVNVISTVPQGTGRESNVNFDINGNLISADSLPMDGTVDGFVDDMPVEYVGLGRAEDLEGVDLTGKIALIMRGEIAFGDKAKNARAANASAVVIYNNVDEGIIRGTLGGAVDIAVVGISLADGEKIVAALAGTEESPEGAEVISNVEVVASDFGALAGTSMATPHVAGIAALVRATNPNLNAVEVKDIIKSSVVEPPVDNSNLKYGKGIVNAFKAVEAAMQN